MELWIRSQGKKFLLKVDDLSIRENHTKLDEYAICFKDNFLGFYNTEQRCIEILDEIENLLVKEKITVYEMPKE